MPPRSEKRFGVFKKSNHRPGHCRSEPVKGSYGAGGRRQAPARPQPRPSSSAASHGKPPESSAASSATSGRCRAGEPVKASYGAAPARPQPRASSGAASHGRPPESSGAGSHRRAPARPATGGHRRAPVRAAIGGGWRAPDGAAAASSATSGRCRDLRKVQGGRKCPSGRGAADALRAALAHVLVQYNPLAGRLGISPEMKLECTGEGAPFVEADAACDLAGPRQAVRLRAPGH